ncbi:MAG: phenylalanine--tRNA ligase subunit beta [Betaproteobacteria bacterium]|nr:phenylalanine--tRNA ligase subunit beta [Betaproteobacteria bacterium]
MKFSENWLRTFVNPALSTRELADAVTMSGVEVEAIEPAAPPFERVVVGEVLSVERHPGAERLTVCRVNVGVAPLTVVCGAPDVRAGIKVPTALVGARLPGIEISAAKVRGVESNGMLCSASELGLSGEAAGLMVLSPDAPIGADVRELLDLDDQLLTTKPTPNRGDCLSVLGVAREVAAITGAPLSRGEVNAVPPAIEDVISVVLEAPRACPRYCGRLIRNVDPRAPVPQWLVARLERSDIRSISAIVDITNYVMLELGQPLHAFDAAKLEGGIRVRFAREREQLTLLNGESPELRPDFLVIADDRKALALAGIMGGAESAVGDGTRDIFLESAFFDPDVIAGKPRRLGFGSESSYRFERGVDFAATRHALERATELVLEICGGAPGPVSEACAALPPRPPVALRLARVERILGIRLSPEQVRGILQRLGFECAMSDAQVQARPPAYRFDIAIEEDLIEEVARIHGYDNIPAAAPAAPAVMLPAPEARRDAAAVRRLLVARDYQEIVTYSFVDRQWEADFCGNAAPIALANPIASQMSVMRSSLIGSLVNCVAFNENYKQSRVRLFEIGRCFERAAGDGHVQPVRVGAIAYGDALDEQWGAPSRKVDFYDVKADVEALLSGRRTRFDAAAHPALHPGKSARIVRDGIPLGWIGELHPRLQQKYDLRLAPVLFELDFEQAAGGEVPTYNEISRFPPVRRDLAVVVDENTGYQAILESVRRQRPAIVTEIGLFDVYRGAGVEKGKKSLAFRVLLQDTQKTLTDTEVECAISELIQVLQQQFDAKLR